MISFIQTQNGNYIKASEVTFVYSDKNNIYCTAGICPKIILGSYKDEKRCEELKTNLVLHLSKLLPAPVDENGIYNMPVT